MRALVPLVAAAALSLPACGGGGGGAAAAPAAPAASDRTVASDPAVVAGRRFLDRYLEADGRVVRHDQGGDTVSEGQAYAMLVSQAVGDRDRFDASWTWAEEHLQREDGLLAWQWEGGRVVDDMPASDADLDAAWALLLAADRFDEPTYRDDALRLAQAVLDHETLRRGGRPVLVAGPWAVAEPAVVNPSYYSPLTFDALADADADAGAGGDRSEWEALAEAGVAQLDDLVSNPPILPPDWAVVDGEHRLRPSHPPGRAGAPVRYGLDAARLLIRSAATCEAGWAELAASAWPALSRSTGQGAALAYDVGGGTPEPGEHAAMAVAAASAASAAGEQDAAAELLARAERLDADSPSYYGSAWIAMGRLLLPPCVVGTSP